MGALKYMYALNGDNGVPGKGALFKECPYCHVIVKS